MEGKAHSMLRSLFSNVEYYFEISNSIKKVGRFPPLRKGSLRFDRLNDAALKSWWRRSPTCPQSGSRVGLHICPSQTSKGTLGPCVGPGDSTDSPWLPGYVKIEIDACRENGSIRHNPPKMSQAWCAPQGLRRPTLALSQPAQGGRLRSQCSTTTLRAPCLAPGFP